MFFDGDVFGRGVSLEAFSTGRHFGGGVLDGGGFGGNCFIKLSTGYVFSGVVVVVDIFERNFR